MIAVLFEVELHDCHKQRYLDLAAELRPSLERIPGFISIERFQSLANNDRLLSLSFWQSEQAVLEWKRFEAHQQAQQEGRARLFKDYRISIAQIVRSYDMASSKAEA
ncbi:antibiotic biosynthesis monooxygenase family protein [Marinobacterium arenosum]|uniref:antibiotic biosynthesis monooxygenase family protein n=1 Tax=Marinobacterium arenosum TaxID=2862496 RepID=UPI001C96A35C|nr:antibiotic biosynthesis monooxygenase [Marinobacterium arenosum]MBY4675214.1 antibiotic biosynthesis monooxygenase [Marinobacterium arenosum]